MPTRCSLLRRSIALLLWFKVVAAQTRPSVLVYSATAGYRHDSIPTAIEAIRNISTGTSAFDVTFSEDPTQFTSSNLAQYQAITFLSNSDEVLNATGKTALRQWLNSTSGALIALHAGNACLFTTPFFGTAVGSWFDYHPVLQRAVFTKVGSHPTTDPLPDRYEIPLEEVYHYRTDPRASNVTVILSVDSSSFVDPEAGTRPYWDGPAPRPIAWYRESSVDLSNGTGDASNSGTMRGRMWYTSLGHTTDTWLNATFQAHVQAGMLWALGLSTTNVSQPSGGLPSVTTSVAVPSGTSAAATTAATSATPTGGAAQLSAGGLLVALLLAALSMLQ